jgi:hypothetical protein
LCSTSGGSFKSYDHSAFRVSYPDNWEVFGYVSSAVTIAPRAGTFGNAIAYGVVINGAQPQARRGTEFLDDKAD